MSLKDSALAVLQRNHERNQPATSGEKTMQLDTHLEGGKVASNNKLLIAVSDACAGLDMTTEQLIQILNSKGKNQIIDGEISASKLKDYAKQIDNAINDGVVKFITDMVEKEFNRNIANE